MRQDCNLNLYGSKSQPRSAILIEIQTEHVGNWFFLSKPVKEGRSHRSEELGRLMLNKGPNALFSV